MNNESLQEVGEKIESESNVNIYCVRFDNPAFPDFDNQADIAYVVSASIPDAIKAAADYFKLDSDFNGKNINVFQVNISQDNDQVAFLVA